MDDDEKFRSDLMADLQQDITRYAAKAAEFEKKAQELRQRAWRAQAGIQYLRKRGKYGELGDQQRTEPING